MLHSDASQHRVGPFSPTAPINSLPAEVLAAIFEQLAICLYHHSWWSPNFSLSPPPRSSSSASPTPPIYSWVRVIRVCKLWRIAALNSPSLWTYVHASSLSRVTGMLSLSRAAPLTVRCLAFEDHPQPRHARLSQSLASSFNRVLDAIHRVKSLELSINQSTRSPRFSALFSGALSAPQLRSLFIYGKDIHEPYVPCAKWSLPALERLELRAPLSTFWAPFITGSLKHLVLDSCYERNSSADNLLEAVESLSLLDVLKEVPLLQSLVIRLDNYTGTLEASATRIPMPELQLLRLSGHSAHCINLLTSLGIAATTTVVIDGTKNHRRPDSRRLGSDTANIAFVLNRMLKDTQDLALEPEYVRRPLSVSLGVKADGATFSLRAWTNSESLDIFEDDELEPDFDIVIPCRQSEANLESLLSMLSLRHIRCLEIDGMEIAKSDEVRSLLNPWFQFFEQLQEVHTLRISEVDHTELWLTLLLPHEFAGAGIRFPKLKTLELHALEFRFPYRLYEPMLRPEIRWTDLVGTNDDLFQCLALRNAAGCGAKKLNIRLAYNFAKQHAKVLEMAQVVEEFSWDGSQVFFFEDVIRLG